MQVSDNITVTKNTREHKPKPTTNSDSFGYKNITLSDSQKVCLSIIQNNIITFVEGLAGTGKTLVSLYASIAHYKELPSNRIVVIRTPMEATLHDKVGFLPDDLKSKLEPHFASTKLLLSSLINPLKVESDLASAHKKIEFGIPNFMLGCTLDNCFIIIDEAQTLNPVIMKLLLERIGRNSKIVILGDPSQSYSANTDRQGMRDALSKFFVIEGNEVTKPKFKDIGYFKFEIDDCMRSDIVKTVLEAYSTPSK